MKVELLRIGISHINRVQVWVGFSFKTTNLMPESTAYNTAGLRLILQI